MTSGRATPLLASFADFPEPAEFLEGFHNASDRSRNACFPPVPMPTFTRAAIRFVASFAALIGISLLLASL
jgi:hypothetical protein